MLKTLKERHLTDYGLSTESYKNKKYYRSDGYWQGPIWAPGYTWTASVTLLLMKELYNGNFD